MPPPPPSPPRGNNGAADPLRGDGEEIEDETDGGDRIGVKLVLREDESDVEGEILGALSGPLRILRSVMAMAHLKSEVSCENQESLCTLRGGCVGVSH